jgi:DNA-binding response OmpR family regulator
MIDDDPLIVAVYRRHFERAGFDVAGASDAQSGLAALSDSRPSVVLLDLGLPDLSGVELLRRIRKVPALRELPVVAFTAGTSPEQVLSAWDAQANCVLMKGRDHPARVVDVVRALIGDLNRDADAPDFEDERGSEPGADET